MTIIVLKSFFQFFHIMQGHIFTSHRTSVRAMHNAPSPHPYVIVLMPLQSYSGQEKLKKAFCPYPIQNIGIYIVKFQFNNIQRGTAFSLNLSIIVFNCQHPSLFSDPDEGPFPAILIPKYIFSNGSALSAIAIDKDIQQRLHFIQWERFLCPQIRM